MLRRIKLTFQFLPTLLLRYTFVSSNTILSLISINYEETNDFLCVSMQCYIWIYCIIILNGKCFKKLRRNKWLLEQILYYVNDQTRGEIFKQAVEENNCSSNAISACHRIKDERKLKTKIALLIRKVQFFQVILQF